jgi:poly(3-hydroxyalkanoate) synthetase
MDRVAAFWAAFMLPWVATAAAQRQALDMGDNIMRHAAGETRAPKAPPQWTTPNRVVLDLPTMRLHEFSDCGTGGVPTLIVAPYALHDAAVADIAAGHSLVATLRSSCSGPLVLIDWKSADIGMQYFSIDTLLEELNVAIDEYGGRCNLIGLCQGGWLSFAFAGRFPAKVQRLVLAGAPIDIAAEPSMVSRAARMLSRELVEEAVRVGGGLVEGDRLLPAWGYDPDDIAAAAAALQIDLPRAGAPLPAVLLSFRSWCRRTLNLPGTFFLQVYEWLFCENRLAAGTFPALGKIVDPKGITAPLYVLAGSEDELTSPGQALAAGSLVGTPRRSIATAVVPCGHLGLFMGQHTLASEWPRIGRWLASPAASPRSERARRPRRFSP